MERKAPIAIFVVGEPGTGKTSAVRLLLEHENAMNKSPKWTMGGRGKVAAAGHYTGTKFDGADTVPYNGVEAALAFWGSALSRYERTFFDGDRFSNQKVVSWLASQGAELRCVLLHGSEIAASRRAARGSKQNPAWVKGRVTKSRRFYELSEFEGKRLEIEISERLDARAVAEKISAFLA